MLPCMHMVLVNQLTFCYPVAGYSGIQQVECEAKSCCWRPVPSSQAAQAAHNDAPWCFYPSAPATNYIVTDIVNQGRVPGIAALLGSYSVSNTGLRLHMPRLCTELCFGSRQGPCALSAACVQP
jgi:hypothetical protein